MTIRPMTDFDSNIGSQKSVEYLLCADRKQMSKKTSVTLEAYAQSINLLRNNGKK